MKEIILNGCFGGYGISVEAQVEYFKRKGKPYYIYEEICKGNSHCGYARYEKPTKDYEGITVITCVDHGEFSEKYPYEGRFDADREDEILIQVVKDLGEKANGSCASLYIDEYDDENFIAYVSEYDGSESLELTPVASEKRLKECSSVDEIMDYLESIDIVVKREEKKSSTEDAIEKLISLAKKVLPSAKEKTNNPILINMGAIPDTVEWALMKLSFLSPDDLQGIIEWQDYFIEKSKAKCEELGISY